MPTDTLINGKITTLIIKQPSEISGEIIRNLRVDLGESLSQFGATLKRAINPRAKKPYSRQYISRLEHSKDIITPEIAGAIWSIATAFDDIPAGIGGAVNVGVLAAPNQIPEGAYLPPTALAVKCARPGCAVIFIKDHPFRKYHHPDCRKAHKAYFPNPPPLS